jgi:hypothetical protein
MNTNREMQRAASWSLLFLLVFAALAILIVWLVRSHKWQW